MKNSNVYLIFCQPTSKGMYIVATVYIFGFLGLFGIFTIEKIQHLKDVRLFFLNSRVNKNFGKITKKLG